MVRRLNPPQTQGGQIGVRYELLLGLEDSKRDNAECVSLLSENAEAKTTWFTNDNSKASPYSAK